MKPFSILIADDHNIVRKGIISILKDDPNVTTIYEAEKGKEAFEMIQNNNPDIALMDISLPDMTGIDVIKKVIENSPSITTHFLVISIYDSPEYYYRVIKAGALGLIPKSSTADELLEGIYKVLAGEMFFGPNVKSEKIQAILQHFDTIDFESHDPESVYLTARERIILVYVCKGYQNKQIADKLFISERTVETHRATFMNKLNVRSVAELNQVVRNSDKLSKLISEDHNEDID